LLNRLIRDLVVKDLALGLYGVFAHLDIKLEDVEEPEVMQAAAPPPTIGETLHPGFVLFGAVVDVGVDAQPANFTFAAAAKQSGIIEKPRGNLTVT
jgi:hypothetical protein